MGHHLTQWGVSAQPTMGGTSLQRCTPDQHSQGLNRSYGAKASLSHQPLEFRLGRERASQGLGRAAAKPVSEGWLPRLQSPPGIAPSHRSS